MKKILSIVAFIAMALSVSAQVVVSGEITTNTTWTANNTYLLSGFVYVKGGATLTIEPGTVIKGDKVSKGTLIVTRNGKINAAGTPGQPIVFTSNEIAPTYGDWGGIIILGKAATNSVVGSVDSLGSVEGGVNNAAGDGLYGGGDGLFGGTNNADNSGTFSYVRIEYPGIAFQPNNEINGLTMAGVGSGTTIDHVQVSYSGDDSFEWFGGTVNCKYLIAYRGLDDDFDADNGYVGRVQFGLAVRDGLVADASRSNGLEIDNDATGSATLPKTAPIFSNITVVGPSGTIDPNYGRAAHLRRNNEIKVYNSVFIGGYTVGLFIDGNTIGQNVIDGKLKVKNSFFHGMATPLSSNATNFDNAALAAYATANAISVGTNSADAKLVDPFNLNAPNPRPDAGSPVLNYAKFTDTEVTDFFFSKVTYAGAFGPTGDWTCNWARFGQSLQNSCVITSQETIVSGNITTNTTWTKDKTYLLQGFVYVKGCATLTIEPGTVIKGDKATKGALIITRCSKIIADGTQSEPIIFTSAEENPTYGDWGGLILLGTAATNSVAGGIDSLGIIEGGVNNAAGDGLYGGGDGLFGGTNNADNSGVLRYVRIQYPGIAFQPNNEINGLTMGGVGSGTLIDNVQVSYSGDDSFEWFGGTVNCKHLIAYRGLDDDFDADNGYSGKVQFAFAVRDPLVADQSGSNGFEIDNDATGSTAIPKTAPTFSNVTVVGPSGTVDPLYRRGAHLRRNNEIKLFNTVVVGAYPVGLFIDGNSTAQNVIDGKLKVKNSFFHGMATPLSSNATNGFDLAALTAYAATNKISVGTNAADAKLQDPFNVNAPNARPQSGSPVLGYAAYTDPELSDFFFSKVGYAGAFGPSNDWTCGWARFGQNLQNDCVPSITGQVLVNGNITTNTTWTKDKEYTIQGFVYVKNCATLTIEPGTVIKGDKGSKGALIVTRCSKLIADGTVNEPIVFTTNDPNPTYGSWGGLILLGRAATNSTTGGIDSCGVIEGGVNNAEGDGIYGGCDLPGGTINDDNSGILRYVRIEYPGIAFQPNNEINGLTLGGVGSGTIIDNVQVSYSGDDSFEWFGGTVNCKHLIAYRGLDDDFDADNGYSGKVQFAYAVRDPLVADQSGSNGFEIDNDATGSVTVPKTAPTFSNVTIVGPSGTFDPNYRRGAHLRRNNEIKLFNTVVVGAYPVGLFIDGNSTGQNVIDGKLKVKNSFFHGMATPLSSNATNGFDLAALTAYATANKISVGTNAADAKLTDPFNINAPNARPQAGSPVLGYAAYTDPELADFFFSKVGYAGAFGPSGDWTCGWARFGQNLENGCVPTVTGEVLVNGNITQNTTWTKDKEYTIQGFVYVKNCATLTIEPGTVIKGDKGSKGALIVTRCSKLIADGTAEEPIVFTTNDPNPTYGSWGGLIILGRAHTNSTTGGIDSLGVIEGGVQNAEGDGFYGNGDSNPTAINDDNSGILRYVRIEYPGIAFQPNNEINGLTLGGVGSGTVIENVQVSYSGDDSFEWFGGTVNCKNLIAYRGLDDDFDADNGYSGKVQFGLSVRDPLVADQSGSNGMEVDNDATGSTTAPKTSAIFSNITVIGPDGATVDANYRRGAHLRRNNEIKLHNSVFIGKYPVGLFVDGASTVQNIADGKLKVKNSFFHGMATPLSITGFDVAALAAFATANNISVGTNSADAKLTDPFNLETPNARPQSTSPVLGYAKFTDPEVADFFFSKVSYAGAFGGSGDWTCPWSKFGANLDKDCILATPTEVVVSGNITQNTTWTSDKEYILQGFVYVKNCATLTIQAGTVIKGDKASKGALIVTRCAKIIADGTQNEPIVFTSAEPNPTYGDWGGVIILGRAHTNSVTGGIDSLGVIEGGVQTPDGDGFYGNGDSNPTAINDDNSGILRYVRIEYPGIAFQPNNEINGLTLGGVGSGTTIDHVQVSYSGDDSYEWFGGTVNCKHLIAYRGLDDDFDADNGYSGSVQYALAVRDGLVADQSGSNGFEIDNDATGSTNAPKTKPTFSNVTVVGPSGTVDPLYRRAAHFRRNSEPGLFNSLLIGSYPVGLLIDGNSTADNATNGLLEVKNTWFAGQATLISTNATNGFNATTWFNTTGWGNGTAPNSSDAKLANPFNLDFPNAQPNVTSPVFGAAAFTASRINTAFFDKVTYVGAFDGTIGGDWTCGWAKFLALNETCFVDTKDANKFIGNARLMPTVTSTQTTLAIELSDAAELNVEIYSINGQFVGQVINERAVAGEQMFTINTSGLANGFYFVRVQAGTEVKTLKMIKM